MDTLRVSRLTDRQRLCLRLVHAHMSSKEIAPHLGVEPGTVDQYIKAAMAVLGVGERRTAARMLVEYEDARSGGAASMTPQAAFDPPMMARPSEIQAAIGHGFRSVLTFSGRDTSRQFWFYAAFLAILNCEISVAITWPLVSRASDLALKFQLAHPNLSIVGRGYDISTQLMADMRSLWPVLCLVAVVHLVLIAAAIARRLHDHGRIELWAHLAIPAAVLALLLRPQTMGMMIAAPLMIAILYALIRGGAPERIGGAISLATMVGGGALFFGQLDRFQWDSYSLLIESATFLAFAILALHANRFWPIWMTAVIGFGMATHVATLLTPDVTQMAYFLVTMVWNIPISLLMIGGTYGHRVRLARDGADPAWTSRFIPSRRSA